jgi:hypothetical protein
VANQSETPVRAQLVLSFFLSKFARQPLIEVPYALEGQGTPARNPQLALLPVNSALDASVERGGARPRLRPIDQAVQHA